MSTFTHLGEGGEARMVDVTEKTDTTRIARAIGEIRVGAEVAALIRDGAVPKGDVFAVARVAAIQAAKRTSELIPLCHPLPIGAVDVDVRLDDGRDVVIVEARVKVTGKTGVEMEALTAVSVGLLTVYDMAKSVTKDMIVGPIRLLEKSGGKSGLYTGPDAGVIT